MLPSELLISRQKEEEISPKYLPLDHNAIARVTEQIDGFQSAIGKSQSERDRQLALLVRLSLQG
jgi:predicted nuclease of restriction endonuclease-like RecB superfamily